MTIRRKMAAVLTTAVVAIAAPAMADDLLLTKPNATELIQSNVGKPFWQMEAQCAGMFGAAYAYYMDRHNKTEAERARDVGISMLNEAVARLELDRGLDQPTALNLAAGDVETGRAAAKAELEDDGAGPRSGYNVLRSACFDISDAQRKQSGRR